MAVTFPALSLAALGTSKSEIRYPARQIIVRLNAALRNPAPYSGVFKGDPRFGRLATVTDCEGTAGIAQEKLYTCRLSGLPVAAQGTVFIDTTAGRVTVASIEIESTKPGDVGAGALASMSFILAGTAMVIAVDPLAMHYGIAAKRKVTQIMETLLPTDPRETTNTVQSDGLEFKRALVPNGQMLSIRPAV
ncbi:MAG: hypothetical protein KGL42_17045 [Betaproteobacteria bacterium]|nr:hypothetical protein [Betaproteobacteria bacterium]